MHKTHAFTRTELLILLAVIGLFAAIHLPLLAATRGRADLAQCTSNLQQVGAAMRIWADEHGGRLPYRVQAEEGGSHGQLSPYSHFLQLSNHLASARLLTCPSSGRVPATAWPSASTAPSYVLGLHGVRGDPREMWLLESAPIGGSSGRCDVGGVTATHYDTVFDHPTNGSLDLRWQPGHHDGLGNILMGDGSVALTSASGLSLVFASEPQVSGHKTHLLQPR